MTIPGDIAAGGVERTKDPGALVANFAARVIVPGIEQGIGGCLHLFVGSDVDGLIGIIVIGAGARITGEAGSIGHRRVDGVATKVAVVRTEVIGSTLSV